MRRTTADQLYVALVTYEDIVPDEANMDAVTSILCDTSWYGVGRERFKRAEWYYIFRDGAIEVARQQRNTLCTLLNVTPPKSKVSHTH